ncbi:hypothetical protein JL09_g1485 [Pichia kudriavzevii]|uniref:Mvd1 C-terminal domain-containing protein n=1 Tax=Pichia kudriavzevii TaxID=4909 RepID=A0A099P3F8_PICKU|nr:hypothetical protein JL09_g1485 [Pichia kudriavzevii]
MTIGKPITLNNGTKIPFMGLGTWEISNADVVVREALNLINLLNQSAGETIAAYTFDAGPNAVIYYEQKNEKFVLGMLHHFFSHLEGWAKYEPQNGVINDSFPLSALDREVYSRGVSRIILTQVGEGPTQTNDVLIDLESGLPKSN